MEEKINNQKIFSYVPSLIARLILNSSLQDKDIFSDNSNSKLNPLTNSIAGKQNKGKSTFLTSLFINPSIYPINNDLPNTIVMNIRLKGFQRLITTLSIKDPKNPIIVFPIAIPILILILFPLTISLLSISFII